MYKLLLLDDEQPILSALRRVISRIPPQRLDGGCSMATFTDPAQALDSLRDEPCDLILADYRLPGMDGLDFLRRAIEIQPDVARIVISGQADLPVVLSAINDARVFRFVSKPWSDAELQLCIVQALQDCTLRRENQRLADLVRSQQNALSRHEAALRQLEAECPGITQVVRDESGAIFIDEDD
ncbi:MAG TPA: response regulator [Rhodanobacteraceae bacterium]|nr:response regulator [Rhodanobacteraceae bacterium]